MKIKAERREQSKKRRIKKMRKDYINKDIDKPVKFRHEKKTDN